MLKRIDLHGHQINRHPNANFLVVVPDPYLRRRRHRGQRARQQHPEPQEPPHIIHKNDPHVKADFVVKVPDLYDR